MDSCSGNGSCDDTSGEPVCSCTGGLYGPKCDNDCSTVPACTGDRRIASAQDLAAVQNCSSIDGALRIERTDLTDLTGLECLQSVTGIVTIGWNDGITSLQGLRNLQSVGQNFSIVAMNGLTDLGGLDSLASVGRHLVIRDNTGLVSLNGLEGVTSVGGNLEILRNADSLVDITRPQKSHAGW